MKRAAKQYLRQVKKHLCCPRPLKKKYLRQLEDDVHLFCEGEDADYTELKAHFGDPADVAADFFSQADPCAVSRFAYGRLRLAYFLLALTVIASLSIVTVNALDHMKTQQLLGETHTADTVHHLNGEECSKFYVRTNYRGRDVYWEYCSCVGGMWLSVPPELFDGTEPYATDVYLNNHGVIEHWNYSDENFHWIRVLDTDIQKEG